MFKCPKCGGESDYLKHYQESTVSYDFSLASDGFGQYNMDEIMGGEDSSWECPTCGEELCRTEQRAIELLKGG